MYISSYNRTLALLFHLGGLRPKDMKVSPSLRAHSVIYENIMQCDHLGNHSFKHER